MEKCVIDGKVRAWHHKIFTVEAVNASEQDLVVHFGQGVNYRVVKLDFSDLPQMLGSKVYQVLKTGAAINTFKYEHPESSGSVYQVSILPFQKQDAALPSSALLVAEDHTQSDRLQRLGPKLDARLKDRADAIRQSNETLESLFLVMKDLDGFRLERLESLRCRRNLVGQTLSELVCWWHD